MKRIVIDIYNEEDNLLNDLAQIKSEELNFDYSDTGMNMHGLQCNFEGNTKEYVLLMDKIVELNDIAREVVKLS